MNHPQDIESYLTELQRLLAAPADRRVSAVGEYLRHAAAELAARGATRGQAEHGAMARLGRRESLLTQLPLADEGFNAESVRRLAQLDPTTDIPNLRYFIELADTSSVSRARLETP